MTEARIDVTQPFRYFIRSRKFLVKSTLKRLNFLER